MTNDGSAAWDEDARIRCEFRFKCPQVWERLQPTTTEGIRYCPECRRDVYLALTGEDFRKHRDEGRCIAVPVVRSDQETDPDERVYLVGQVESPYDDQ